ncbi:hypothetical protein K501DRAFT_281099 [Backusella circina FSU 941]|nr:hypothetical protein K501DRAFT_281099 [Backusella circina FSU 941]
MQCTCHETAKTLLLSGNPNGHHSSQAAANTPGAPPPPISEAKGKEFAWLSPESSSRTRNSFDDSNYYALQRSHSSSLRFLEGQTKSPRRRSSITRKYSCKRTSAIASTQSDSGSSSSISSNSHIIENNINNNNGHFVLNQNCATIPPSATSHTMMSDYSENENAMFIDMQSFDYGVLPHHLITEADPVAAMPVTNNNCYIPCSASSMTSTPTVLSSSIEEKSSMMMYEDFHLTNTDPDELTTLLNNVLNDEHSPRWTTTTSSSSRSSVDMTRTTSSSSGILAPPRATTTTVCGSLTPHTNCCPPIDTQGQSVVITITPLLCKDVKSQPMTTKIVTCYCGSACHCPGCFVHPDNNQLLYPSFHPSTASSTSSSYSSDDEEHLLYA